MYLLHYRLIYSMYWHSVLNRRKKAHVWEPLWLWQMQLMCSPVVSSPHLKKVRPISHLMWKRVVIWYHFYYACKYYFLGKIIFFSGGLLFIHSQYGSITVSKDHIRTIKFYDPVCTYSMKYSWFCWGIWSATVHLALHHVCIFFSKRKSLNDFHAKNIFMHMYFNSWYQLVWFCMHPLIYRTPVL